MLSRIIQSEADAAGRVDWSVSIDSSIVRAHRGEYPLLPPLQNIPHRGACGQTRVVLQHRRPMPEPAEVGVTKCVCCFRHMGYAGMSNRRRGGLAVRLRTLCAEVRVCAPPGCAELLARVGVPLVPIGVWR
jgi:hypothetical protein